MKPLHHQFSRNIVMKMYPGPKPGRWIVPTIRLAVTVSATASGPRFVVADKRGAVTEVSADLGPNLGMEQVA